MPMENNETLLNRVKSQKTEVPRRSVIKNLINYSKSLEVFKDRYNQVFLFVNN